MPRASGQKEYVSLVKGLVTEASPLNFPEGATADELNFTVSKNGLIRNRRKGFQNLYPVTEYPELNAKLENTFYWRGPNYLVVVVTDATPRTQLRFHAIDESFTFISSVNIADARCVTQISATTNALTVALDGNRKPIYCEYDSVTEEIKVYEIGIYIRDFECVDDELGASERPLSLSDDHKYNLYNAGWYQRKPDANDADTVKNTVDAWFAYSGSTYPSNADIVSLGLITNDDGETTFQPKEVDNADLGNSLAPRGHYVYPIDDIDRDYRIANPSVDGAPASTVTLLGTVSLAGVPTYNPDAPSAPSNPGTGSGVNPFPPQPVDPNEPPSIEP